MWTCSMHPQIRQPNPGDCPICGMDLIPVTKTSGGLRTLTVSPEARALMDVESVPVERRYVSHRIRMVGKVDYDETKLGYITAWVSGRLDRLYVDYTGVEVNQGDHMAYIYSEQLYSAQQELIQAVRFSRERRGTSDIGGVNLRGSSRKTAAAGIDRRANPANREPGQTVQSHHRLFSGQRYRHRQAQAGR
jgi:Cu(I)/Ag(I) efflux system membrane fusion protein